MISIDDLPSLNAVLNGTSAVLLTLGYLFIRRKKVNLHKACMVSAFVHRHTGAWVKRLL